MTQGLAENAQQTHAELLEAIAMTKKSFVLMGQLLYKLRRNESYKTVVGEGADTWADYLSQPEIGLTKGEAGRLMSIYEVFCLNFGYSPEEIGDVPVKNMHYLLPVAKNMEDREEVDGLLNDARQLKQSDFKERVYDFKTEETGERTYSFVVMRKCNETNNLQKVHGISNEDIKDAFGEQLEF